MLVLEDAADLADLELVELGEVLLVFGQQPVQVRLDVVHLVVDGHPRVPDLVLLLLQKAALARAQQAGQVTCSRPPGPPRCVVVLLVTSSTSPPSYRIVFGDSGWTFSARLLVSRSPGF